jgi:protein TonB
VILEIVVTRNGDVADVKVLKSHPLFDQAAIAAVKKWRYNPALQSGRPVKVFMTVVVDFKLK